MTEIRTGYFPGALGQIIELHETYYGENWQLDYEFAREVAVELAEFLDRYDEDDNCLWLVVDDSADDRALGSIVIDAGHSDGEEGVRLRWFILDPNLHGRGLGRELMDQAMRFCADNGFRRVYLWTYEELKAARHLYETHGFTLVEEVTRADWGPRINYQKLEFFLPDEG